MKTPSLQAITIRKIKRHLQARQFAIPKLQRNFVWDPGRAAKLLDSIYQQMPIGSLFLWEVDRKSANLIRQSAEIIPSFNSKNKVIWFVIDGQQRLSVIYQAFEAQTRRNDVGRQIDFGRLCFVPTPDAEQENPPRVIYRKPLDRQFVSIRDILSSEWKNRMPTHAKAFLRKIEDFRRRFLAYPIPVVTIRSAALEEVGEIFIRVNSQGSRITSADRAIALMGELDVRAMAQELRQKVRDEVFALAGIDPILMGFNLIVEAKRSEADPPKLEAMARRWSKRIERDSAEKDRFRKIWHKYQAAFRTAVDHLRANFPVYDETYLPSANMLATLSIFFFHHSGQPNGYQATQIRKWFWATGVAQRYSGRGYHRNIVADAQFFKALAEGKKKSFVFRNLLDPELDNQGSEYVSRSARTRAFFCLLAANKPLYLENGEPISLEHGVVSHANRKDRHHIFPQAQLRGHLSSRASNSLCNICFLVSRENSKIGKRIPRSYLNGYREAGRQRFRRIMKSHLIPVSEDSGIWERGLIRGFKEFRRQRLKLVCAEFEKKAGMKLFQRS